MRGETRKVEGGVGETGVDLKENPLSGELCQLFPDSLSSLKAVPTSRVLGALVWREVIK